MKKEAEWVDIAIARLLRTGVLLSITIVSIGVVMMFIHHPAYFSSRPELGQLTRPDQPFPHTVAAVVRDAAHLRGQSLVMLGLLLLIATPVARVAMAIGIFLIERDRLYVLITTLVLALLIASLFAGEGLN